MKLIKQNAMLSYFVLLVHLQGSIQYHSENLATREANRI